MSEQPMACTAVVLAGGSGKRMQGNVRKQYLELKDATGTLHPILYYSLKAMQDSPVITEIVLVTPAGEEDWCKEEIVSKVPVLKPIKIVSGGSERYHSVARGLEAIDWPCDLVFIHDGARPFIDEESISRLADTAKECGACVAGMPSKDTISVTDSEGRIVETPDRSLVWSVQTPQVFPYEEISKSYEEMERNLKTWEEEGIHITDDAMVYRKVTGAPVHMVEASYRNIKITTPEDLLVGEAFLSDERN